MAEIVQPILIALAVLLIPACARLAVTSMTKKLDQGKVIAIATAADLKKANAEEAANVATILDSHRKDMADRLDRIEIQTTSTNGKVAEHEKRLTTVEAETRLLVKLFPGQQQPQKGQPE